MLEKVPRMCITCQHYKPYQYRCGLEDSYIGYIDAELRTKCKRYSLSEHYRKGGKFYKYRVKEGKNEESNG